METKRHVDKKRIVYLFLGCILHGHQGCADGKLEHRGVSNLDRGRMTELQEAAYKRTGFEEVRVWKCEWKKMKKECLVRMSPADPNIAPSEELLKSYVKRVGDDMANQRLVIGDALYGGRTEALVYYYPSGDGSSKICYLKFISLYLWVQKTQEFPLGIPMKLVGDKIPKPLISLKE